MKKKLQQFIIKKGACIVQAPQFVAFVNQLFLEKKNRQFARF
jgi:hypothetical protein